MSLSQGNPTPCWRLTEGGLACGDRNAVQAVAMRCLKLFDQNATGSEHAQSRRFCCPNWVGLRGGPAEPPLRNVMERVASGNITLHDLVTDGSEEVKLFFYWVSSFRLVPVSRIPYTLIFTILVDV